MRSLRAMCRRIGPHSVLIALLAVATVSAVAEGQRTSTRDRDVVADLLGHSETARGDPTRVSTPHLSGSTSVVPGPTRSRVTLVVAVTPRPGFRIYAVGAKDFIPVTLTVDRTDGVTMERSTFSKPELIAMEGASERVPAYAAAFRVEAKLVLDAVREAEVKGGRPVTLTGTLQYQACDDRVCYKPVSVPVHWTVRSP